MYVTKKIHPPYSQDTCSTATTAMASRYMSRAAGMPFWWLTQQLYLSLGFNCNRCKIFIFPITFGSKSIFKASRHKQLKWPAAGQCVQWVRAIAISGGPLPPHSSKQHSDLSRRVFCASPRVAGRNRLPTKKHY